MDVALTGRMAWPWPGLNPYDRDRAGPDAARLDGFQILERLRDEGVQVPVIILTARDAVDDKIRGLDLGRRRLPHQALRVRGTPGPGARPAAARPATGHPPVLKVADLTLDPAARRVTRADQRIELTAKEYALLEYLMRHHGRVLTRTMISEHVWDQTFDSYTNVIDVYVNYLRKKVDQGFEPKLIHTVRGRGLHPAGGAVRPRDPARPAHPVERGVPVRHRAGLFGIGPVRRAGAKPVSQHRPATARPGRSGGRVVGAQLPAAGLHRLRPPAGGVLRRSHRRPVHPGPGPLGQRGLAELSTSRTGNSPSPRRPSERGPRRPDLRNRARTTPRPCGCSPTRSWCAVRVRNVVQVATSLGPPSRGAARTVPGSSAPACRPCWSAALVGGWVFAGTALAPPGSGGGGNLTDLDADNLDARLPMTRGTFEVRELPATSTPCWAAWRAHSGACGSSPPTLPTNCAPP